jgi:hypothetical protein
MLIYVKLVPSSKLRTLLHLLFAANLRASILTFPSLLTNLTVTLTMLMTVDLEDSPPPP